LACTFASPCLGHVPKAKVATKMYLNDKLNTMKMKKNKSMKKKYSCISILVGTIFNHESTYQ
jgi:hypothetical protein